VAILVEEGGLEVDGNGGCRLWWRGVFFGRWHDDNIIIIASFRDVTGRVQF